MATGEEALDRVRDLLEEIVSSLELDADIEVTQDDEGILGTLEGEDLGLFIGRRGQTIDAVQHLATRIVQRDAGDGERVRVTIDAAGWRERRREALEEEADEAAERAIDEERPVSLEPMSAAERRIVHQRLRDREDVETHSEGDEPRRYLVVSPAVP